MTGSARRRLSRHLMRQALAAAPEARRDWIEAMRTELDHVDDDGEALAFAWGAVHAAWTERLGGGDPWTAAGRLTAGAAATGYAALCVYASTLDSAGVRPWFLCLAALYAVGAVTALRSSGGVLIAFTAAALAAAGLFLIAPGPAVSGGALWTRAILLEQLFMQATLLAAGVFLAWRAHRRAV